MNKQAKTNLAIAVIFLSIIIGALLFNAQGVSSGGSENTKNSTPQLVESGVFYDKYKNSETSYTQVIHMQPVNFEKVVNITESGDDLIIHYQGKQVKIMLNVYNKDLIKTKIKDLKDKDSGIKYNKKIIYDSTNTNFHFYWNISGIPADISKDLDKFGIEIIAEKGLNVTQTRTGFIINELNLDFTDLINEDYLVKNKSKTEFTISPDTSKFKTLDQSSILLDPTLGPQYASADTYINDGAATTNYGTATTLPFTATNKVLIDFDMSSIPAGSSVTSALASIRYSAATSGDVKTMYPLKVSWTEGGATYNTRDGSTGWNAPGLTAGTDYDTTAAYLATNNGGTGYKDYDVTIAVNASVNGLLTMYGWMLNNQDSTSHTIYAKEQLGTSYDPYITITYDLPMPTITISPADGYTTNNPNVTFQCNASFALSSSGNITELYVVVFNSTDGPDTLPNGGILGDTWYNNTSTPVQNWSESMTVSQVMPHDDNWYFFCGGGVTYSDGTDMGYLGWGQSNNFIIDTTAPVITYQTPTPATNYNFSTSSITINVSITELRLDTCLLQWNNTATITNYTMTKIGSYCNYTMSVGSDANYWFNVYANDTVGNIGNAGLRKITRDTIKPLVSITSPTNNTNTTITQLGINYTASDASTGLSACKWTQNNGAANTSVTCGTNITGVTWNEGLTTVIVYANDTSGNENSSSVTFRLDTTGPTVTTYSPASIVKDQYNLTVDLKVGATDTGVGVQAYKYSLNGAANITFTPNITIVGVYGSNNLSVYANDTLGNTGISSMVFNLTFTPKINTMNISNSSTSYYRDYLTAASDGLKAWWKMDKNWSIQEDSVAGGVYNGTLKGKANFTNDGLIGGGIILDGTLATGNTYIDTPVVPIFTAASVNESATFVMWIRTYGLQNQTSPASMAFMSAGTNGFVQGNANSAATTLFKGFYIYSTMGGGSDFTGPTVTFNNGVWNMLTSTINKTNYNATHMNYTIINYLNGVYVGQTSNLRLNNTYSVQDLGGLWGSNTLNATMDEVRIYNRSLSATEILNMYSLIRPTFQEYANVTMNVTITNEDGGTAYYQWFVDSVSVLAGFSQNVFNYIFHDRSNIVTMTMNDSNNYWVNQSWNISTTFVVPTIAFSGSTPSNATYVLVNNFIINFTGTESNLQTAKVTVNNVNYTATCTGGTPTTPTYTCGYSFTSMADAVYTVTAWVNDSVGNSNQTTPARVFTLDDTTPLISYGTGTQVDHANVSATNVYVNLSLTETNFANMSYTLFNGTSDMVDDANLVFYLSGDRMDSKIYAGPNLNGTPTSIVQNTTEMKVGPSYQYGGSSNINFGDPTILKVTGNQTICMWLYSTNLTVARQNPWAKAYGGEGTITQETAGTISYYYGLSGTNGGTYQGFASAAGFITLRTWTHLCIVRTLNISYPTNNGTVQYYRNGVASGAALPANYPAAVAGTQPFYIGTGYAGSYRGMIDEVMEFNKALTAGDVSAIYNRSYINHTKYTTSTPTINWTGLPNGYYHYQADILDSAGWYNRTSFRNILLDTAAPVVTVTLPANTTYKDQYSYNLTLNVSATNSYPTAFVYWYSLNGGTNTTFTPNITLPGLVAGSNTIIVYANDSAGNVGSTSRTFYLGFTPKINAINTSNSTTSYVRDSNTTGLVAWWKLDKNYTIQENSVSSSYPLTASATSVFTPDGEIGGAYSLPSTALTGANGITLNMSRGYTFMTYFKTSAANDGVANAILHGANTIYTQIVLRNTTGACERVYFRIQNGTCDYSAQVCADWNDNQWHFLAGTYDGATLKVYYDNQTGTATPSAACLSIYNNWSLITMNNNIPTNTFTGMALDEIRIYNRSLSATEMSQIYSVTNPTFQEYANVTLNATISNEDGGTAYYQWFVNSVSVLVGFSQNILNWIFTSQNNTVQVIINDSSNYNVTQNWNITTIFINPTINFTSPTPTNGSYVNNFIVNITGNETNVNQSWVTFNGINYTATCTGASPYYCNYTFTGIADGFYNYTGYIQDKVGNVNNTETRYITIDNTFPIISFVSPTEYTGTNFSRTWIAANVSVSDTNLDNFSYSLYNSSMPSNLVVYWSLDRNATQVVDLSGNNIEANITNATFQSTAKLGGGYLFNGTSQKMTATIPTITTPYTVAFWYKLGSNITSGVDIISLKGGNSYPKIQSVATGRLLMYYGQEKYRYTPTGTFVAGNWYHVVAVATTGNVSNMHFYVNGILTDGAGGGDTTTYYEPTTSLQIEGYGRDDYIDEFMIFNKSLSTTEISQLYNRSLINRTVLSSTTNPVINWTGLAEGNYHYVADAIDKALNGDTTEIRSIRLDTTAPTVTITLPANTTYRDEYDYNLTLNVSATDTASTISTYWYSLNSGANTTFTPNITLTGLITGSNTIIVYANDSVGNVGSDTHTFYLGFTPKINTINISNSTTSYSNINLSGIINWLRLDKNYTLQEDSAGYLNATVTGATFTDSGKVGGAYSLSPNNYISTATNTVIPSATLGFTALLWIKPGVVDCDANNNYRSLIRVGGVSASTTGWDVVWEQNQAVNFDLGNGTTTFRLNTGTTTTDTWTHYAFRYDYDGNMTSVYKNGVWQANKSIIGKLSYGTNSILNIGLGTTAGACPNGAGYMNGTYDEVMYFNRTLSPSEIQQIYYITNPTFQEYANTTINITITDEDTTSVNLYYSWFIDSVSVLTGFAQNVLNWLFTEPNQIVTVIVNDSNNYNVSTSFNISTTFINPTINFTSPTPNNGTSQGSQKFTVNFTGTEANFNTGWITLDSTNYTATCTGTSPYYCNYSFSGVSTGLHSYTAYVNDSVGNVNNTETRWITINNNFGISESITLTASNLDLGNFDREQNTTITTSESSGRQASMIRTETDSMTMSDTVSRLGYLFKSVLDAISLNVGLADFTGRFGNINDNVTFTDSSGRGYFGTRTNTNSLSFLESITDLLLGTRNVADTIYYGNYETPQDGLIDWWKLDQNSTTQADSIDGTNGTVIGGASYTDSGKYNGAYIVNGSNYILINKTYNIAYDGGLELSNGTNVGNGGWLNNPINTTWRAGIVGSVYVSSSPGGRTGNMLNATIYNTGSYTEIRNNASGYFSTAQTPIKPSTLYRLSGWMKTEGVSGSAATGQQIAFLTSNSGGTSAGETGFGSHVNNISWTYYELYYTTAANAVYAHLEARVYGHNGAGTLKGNFYFDDMKVEEVNTSLVINYKNSTNGWINYIKSDYRNYTNGVNGPSLNYPLYDDGYSLYIGKTNSSDYFNGTIDDIMYYNRSLTSTEALQIYNAHFNTRTETVTRTGLFQRIENDLINWFDSILRNLLGDREVSEIIYYGTYENPQDGLVGWYKLDENNTSQVDSSLNINTATVNGATWDSNGRFNSTYQFDGINDLITIPYIQSYNTTPNNATTISFWIKPNENKLQFHTTYESVLRVSHTLFFISNGSGIMTLKWFNQSGTSGQNLASTTIFSAGNWYHVVFTFDSGTAKAYVNGVLEDTDVKAGQYLYDINLATTLGSGDNKWNGTIDEFIIYNRSISQTEVSQIYNAHFNTRTETVTRIGFFKRITTDLANWVDSVARILFGIRNENDNIIINNSATRTGLFSRITNDLATWFDSLSRIFGGKTTINENISTTDSSGRTYLGNRGTTDTVTFSDSISRTSYLFKSITDPISITISITDLQNLFRTNTDAINLADSISRILLGDREVADTIVYGNYEAPQDGLVGWWTFDQNTTLLDDQSVNDNLGIPVNSAAFTNLGYMNGAYQFNGIDAMVYVPYYGIHNNFTMSLWYNPYTNQYSGNFTALMSPAAGGGQNKWGLMTNSGCLGLQYRNATSVTQSWSPGYCNRLNRWTMVTLIYNSTSWLMYIDGNLNATLNLATSYQNINFIVNQSVGRDNWNTRQYNSLNGTIDEVMIYNRSLSSIEVQQLYNAHFNVPTETVTRTFFGIRTFGDIFTITPNTSRLASLFRNLGQTITETDSSGRIVFFYRADADGFTLTNIVSRTSYMFRFMTDLFTVDTLTSRLGIIFRNFGDAFGLIDSSGRIGSYNRNQTQGIGYNDSMNRQLSATRSTTDAITIGDNYERLLHAFISPGQNIYIIDLISTGTISGAIDEFFVTVTENINVNIVTVRTANIFLNILQDINAILDLFWPVGGGPGGGGGGGGGTPGNITNGTVTNVTNITIIDKCDFGDRDIKEISYKEVFACMEPELIQIGQKFWPTYPLGGCWIFFAVLLTLVILTSRWLFILFGKKEKKEKKKKGKWWWFIIGKDDDEDEEKKRKR